MNNATTDNNSRLCQTQNYPFINNLSKCGFQKCLLDKTAQNYTNRIVDFNLDMELMHQLLIRLGLQKFHLHL